MVRRIEFNVDSDTANKMQGFFASKSLLVVKPHQSNVSFGASISFPGGFGISIDPEKDPRIIPNLVEAIFDAIDIFKSRIKGIKIDGKGYSMDEAKSILAGPASVIYDWKKELE